MAQQTKLAKVLNGLVQNIDLSGDEYVFGSVRVGGLSGTLLDQATLDSLIANSHAAGSDNQNIVAGSGLSGGGSGSTVTVDVNVDGSTIEINSDALRVKDGGITAAKLAAAINAQTFDATNTATNYSPTAVASESTSKISAHLNGINAALGNKIDSSEKGAPSGVATLDGGGKIPASQLPNSVMDYRGNWDASTNSPTLADGSGSAGDVYRVSVAGTQDLGSGAQTYAIGDWAVYNGTIWEKSLNSSSVVSVNGFTGVVVLDTDDIAEGSNLYFTDSRAKTAAVVNSLAGSQTDQAPSVAAVKAALQAQDAANEITYNNGTSGLTATNVQTAIDEVEGRVDALEAGAGSAQSIKLTMVAGESYAANTTFIVRFAVNGETAGRVYKADPGSALSQKKYWAIGSVSPLSAVSAGQNIVVTLAGSQALGSSDTPFSASDLSQPVWLTSAGSFSTTAPTASGSAAYLIGKVATTTSIFVDAKQLTGVN